MLVHNPHDLRRIQSGSSADSDDYIWLEFVHLRQTLHSILNLRVNTNVEELCYIEAFLLQLIDDGIACADLEQVRIGYDECSLIVVNFTQFSQSNWCAASLEVNFLRQLQLQHVFFSCCNGLDIQQLLELSISCICGISPGSRSQCE